MTGQNISSMLNNITARDTGTITTHSPPGRREGMTTTGWSGKETESMTDIQTGTGIIVKAGVGMIINRKHHMHIFAHTKLLADMH